MPRILRILENVNRSDYFFSLHLELNAAIAYFFPDKVCDRTNRCTELNRIAQLRHLKVKYKSIFFQKASS